MKESSSPGLPTLHKDRLIVLPLDGAANSIYEKEIHCSIRLL